MRSNGCLGFCPYSISKGERFPDDFDGGENAFFGVVGSKCGLSALIVVISCVTFSCSWYFEAIGVNKGASGP